jgi:VIT1/CCC1 family predicted Fe2+/Mn2+ transporter
MTSTETTMPHEPHHASENQSRQNWLRASVLGANDGIVSIAGLVLGVAGATNSQSAIFTAGLAGIIAGAISMAAGEYVSVSSQSDSEKALLKKERQEIHNNPEQELVELAATYEKKGLEKTTAMIVAKELTAHDAFAAHVDAELRIDPQNLTNPWHAALASAVSFVCGAAIPLVAILTPPGHLQVPVTFVSVIFALVVTGVISGKVSSASVFRATLRVVGGGALAMAVTYGIGRIFGVAGI